MGYDTAGNKIYEPISNCDCGLTGGCEKCQIREWKIRFDENLEERNKRFFPQEELIDKETEKNFYRKVFN